MPTASTTRTISATPAQIWEIVSDPHHLPRWWPRVERVEAVTEDSFTQVLRSDRGRIVRADFTLSELDEPGMRVVFDQVVAGTPFARVLQAARTEIVLAPSTVAQELAGEASVAAKSPQSPAPDGPAACEVQITLTQTLRRRPIAGPGGAGVLDAFFAHLGAPMVRRASARTVKEALDGLARIAG
jgi:hypothetical protein